MKKYIVGLSLFIFGLKAESGLSHISDFKYITNSSKALEVIYPIRILALNSPQKLELANLITSHKLTQSIARIIILTWSDARPDNDVRVGGRVAVAMAQSRLNHIRELIGNLEPQIKIDAYNMTEEPTKFLASYPAWRGVRQLSFFDSRNLNARSFILIQ